MALVPKKTRRAETSLSFFEKVMAWILNLEKNSWIPIHYFIMDGKSRVYVIHIIKAMSSTKTFSDRKTPMDCSTF